jgi:hypothetical protein
MDFPLPVDHPEYGRYVPGPGTEANIRSGIPWAINARTRNPELCVDFLRFCTTRARNERFGRAVTWIPVVRGARLSERLKPFKPRVKGYMGHFEFYNSAAARLIGEGNRWTLYAGDISPKEYARRLREVYERNGHQGCRDWLEKQRRSGRDTQRILAGLQLQMVRPDSSRSGELSDKALQVLQSALGANARVKILSARLRAAEKRHAEARR